MYSNDFNDYLEKKLQDPRYKARFKRMRRKLRKDIKLARQKSGFLIKVPPEVRKLYSKIKSTLHGKALVCEAWWITKLPLEYGGKTPKQIWEDGNKDFIISLLQLR